MIGAIRTLTKRMFSPKYLLLTNTVSSGVLLSLGDVLQQVNERRIAKKKLLLKVSASGSMDHIGQVDGQETLPTFNWIRTGRMLTIGIFLGPLNHYWYLALDKFLPGVKGRTVAKKILLDELIASPVMTSTFFVGMGLLEGKTLADSIDVLKKKFLTVYMVDIAVWPPVQAINFFLVPPQLRVIYVNVFILLWDVFLSFMNHN
ncbi:mpv17-like protein 2 isoform X2 [Acanthaster planci]|uniref:Mpv17-like protein 2 isoform X2 n=1 Tax=Acanthaster planci TaxID=133434 RepID=A0A8B7YXC8_ACAPL|nr:mpv17-like protein 2 isoform X2 [Acanthaster planci]